MFERRCIANSVVCLSMLVMSPLGSAADAISSQTLTAYLFPVGKLSVPSNVLMTPASVAFGNASGAMTMYYRIRTTPTGGGQVTIQFSEFNPAGGPSIAAGNLTFACSGATLGTPCLGVQTASTGLATRVLTVPSSSCTGIGSPCGGDPHMMELNFSLANRPSYSTGSYSAQVIFTISGT